MKNYQIQKDFIKAIAGSLGIGPNGSRAGVVVSGNDTTVNIKFSDHLNEGDFKKAVDSLPDIGGTGTLDYSLHVVLSQLLVAQGGARPGVSKILIIVAGGKHNETEGLLSIYTTKLLQLGVEVIFVGVGDKVDDKVLTSLLTKGKNVFLEDSFESLMTKTRQVASAACDSAGLYFVRSLIVFYKTTWIVRAFRLVGYCTGKLMENCCYLQLFYNSNRPHFLWVYRRNKPTRHPGGTREKAVSHEREASDLQVFQVFSQHSKWVYHADKNPYRTRSIAY